MWMCYSTRITDVTSLDQTSADVLIQSWDDCDGALYRKGSCKVCLGDNRLCRSVKQSKRNTEPHRVRAVRMV